MDSKHQVSGITALVWAGLVLVGFTLTLLWSQASGFNVYDVEAGWRVLSQQPILTIGKQLTFAWSGAAFVLMVLAFYEWLPLEMRSYSVKTAAVMGLIAGAMFLYVGLVGGFASSDLSYLQSVQAGDAVTIAYLPLTLVTNRGLAAAITVSGFWFVLMNLKLRHQAALPQALSYL